MKLFHFSPPPTFPARIYTSPFTHLLALVPSKEIPLSFLPRPFISPFSQIWHSQISFFFFFSYPQSFSCWSIPLTFYKYAWVFPVWRKSDTGFLLSYLPDVLKKLFILAFPFLSPSRFLIHYSHSCSSYVLSACHVRGTMLGAGI